MFNPYIPVPGIEIPESLEMPEPLLEARPACQVHVVIPLPSVQSYEQPKRVVPTPLRIVDVGVQQIEQRQGPVPAKPKFSF